MSHSFKPVPRSRWSALTVCAAVWLLHGCGGGGGSASRSGIATTRVVFQSDRTGTPQIYLMNGDGTGQVQLTRDAAPALEPSFNRDGSLITFRSRRSGDGSDEIYVMNADGSGQHAVTHDAFDDANPSFSRQDNTLVFESTHGGQSDLYSLDLSSGAEKQLTKDVAFDDFPVFQADGSLVYASNKGGPFSLYILKNGVSTALPRQGNEGQFFPAVSADGRIAFVSDLTGSFEIYVSNADGSGRTRLTQNTVADVDPAFSPDGKLIYFASLVDGNYNLFVTNADGSGSPRRLTTQISAERLPDVR